SRWWPAFSPTSCLARNARDASFDPIWPRRRRGIRRQDKFRMIELSGKVALITGASRGIGASTPIKFAEAAVRGLLLNYNRNRSAAQKVADRCKELGCEAVAYRCDVSKAAETEIMFRQAVTRLGRLDILVANAGIWKRAPIERMTIRQWQETLRVNLDSIYACCHGAARQMLKQKSGTIVLISSTAGQ